MSRLILLFYAILLISTLSPTFHVNAQTSYSIPITLSISNEGLNRSIEVQWSKPDFTKIWSGNVEELAYELHLDKTPIITLSSNSIKLRFNFWIKLFNTSTLTDIFIHKDYSIETSMSVAPISSSSDAITLQYSDISTSVSNALVDVDYRIRNVIVQKLEQINWIIYPGKIVTISSTPLNGGSQALSWSATPTFSSSIKPEGILEIIVTSDITVGS